MSNALTVQQDGYSFGLRVVDGVLRAAEGLGLGLGTLDGEAMRRAAMRSTGLSDFGDPWFEEPMARLLSEVQGAPMTALARVVMKGAFTRALENRLRVEGYHAAHPDLAKKKIERPIFVLGFPRSGTTAVQNLLCLNPQRRALPFWELNAPAPVHPDRAVDERRRIRTAEWMLRAAYMVAPEMVSVHEIRATTPEECWPLFYPSFASLNLDLSSGLDRIGQWLLESDLTPAYSFYERSLQVMANERPGQLVLKCPEHLWFLDALFETFPDACVVWTHRDPVASVASYCSLISLNRRMLWGDVDNVKLGADVTQRFSQGVSRAMKARERWGEDRFFDLDFREFVRDQSGTVQRICKHFGLAHTATDQLAVQEWLGSDRADHRGAHVYSAEKYGLEEAEVRSHFTEYMDRFDLGPQRARLPSARRA